jgi:hypothetical protein
VAFSPLYEARSHGFATSFFLNLLENAKKGIIKPLVRRDGKSCPLMRGLTFYTVLQIYKAINYLFQEIPQHEREAIGKALFTVWENDYRVCPWMK